MGVGVTDLTIRLSDFGIAQRSLVVVLNEGLRLTRLLDARPRGLSYAKDSRRTHSTHFGRRRLPPLKLRAVLWPDGIWS